MLGLISKLFGGSKSEKDVQKIKPQVDSINQYFQQYRNLPIDELRNKTAEFRQRIREHLKEIDAEIEKQISDAGQLSEDKIQEKDEIFQHVDTLRKDRDKAIEEILKEIHP